MKASDLRRLSLVLLGSTTLAAAGCSMDGNLDNNTPFPGNPRPGTDSGVDSSPNPTDVAKPADVLGSVVPTPGQAVPNPTNPDRPGVITTIASATTPTGNYLLVTATYPPPWNCPADWTNDRIAPSTTEPALGDGALTATTCQGVANLRRSGLKSQAQSTLNSTRQSLLSPQCTESRRMFCTDANGVEVSYSLCMPYVVGVVDGGVAWSGAGGSMAIPSGGSGGSSTTATTYSTTNTQIATVDEADYVKNDGNTIFVLTGTGLRIIDAWPAAETREVGKLTLPGEPRRLFFENNRLVVYSRLQNTATTGAGSSNPSSQGCTYGYGCRFESEGGHTLILVYDVSTPAAPKELVRYELSGGYVASRRVGSFIYSVVHDTGAPQIPGLDYTIKGEDYATFQADYLAKAKANADHIDQVGDAYFQPWVTRVRPGESAQVATECTEALASPSAKGTQFVSLVAFDLTTLGAPTRTLVASRPGYVFASPTALYMAVDRVPEEERISAYQAAPMDSVIHKFRLEGARTTFAGSALLPGHILNQFAMDEYDGVLRVASTRGWVPTPGVTSTLSTYREQAGDLIPVGQVGNIAPNEDIRSVRFDGDRGYVVTFKKTDPLFVLDLADPAKPAVLGELKIPGFSTYMQKLDATHLLAIGFDADEQGSFAYFNGIQIQIFDVADLANPKLAWKTTIGTRGSGSEALSNHLAFNYFAPNKMLALPITVCEGGGDGAYGTDLTFAGLMVFDVSLETGITEHGRLSFIDAPQSSTTDSCNKWWTDANSLVKRSIFMDDFVYGLSDGQLRVANLSSMSRVLQSVPLSP